MGYSSLLWFVHHAATARVNFRTCWAGPSPISFFSALDFPLVLHSHTAAATTSLEYVVATAARDLVCTSDAGPMKRGEEPPQSARQAHDHAVVVCRAVAEHVCGVILC